MVQASPQVTAAQVLDAGRRAEADGRVEYAIQFYRHLTEHHSGAPEAAAARDALSRLKRQTISPERPPTPPPLRSAGHRSTSESLRRGEKVGRGPIRIAPAGSTQQPAPLELPEATGGYLAGRLIAYGFTALGVLLLVAGLMAAAAATALPAELAARLPVWLPALPALAGPVAVGAGLLLVFSGQFARAVFDLASASRDIAAIERAKVEHANAALR